MVSRLPRLLAATLGAGLVVLALAAVAEPAAAQEPPPAGATVTERTVPPPEGGVQIIPRPNSGREPETPFDRGGWAQLALLAGILAGMGVIVAMIVRESRRRRRSVPGATAGPRPGRTSA